jgi:hypothetical protein
MCALNHGGRKGWRVLRQVICIRYRYRVRAGGGGGGGN